MLIKYFTVKCSISSGICPPPQKKKNMTSVISLGKVLNVYNFIGEVGYNSGCRLQSCPSLPRRFEYKFLLVFKYDLFMPLTNWRTFMSKSDFRKGFLLQTSCYWFGTLPCFCWGFMGFFFKQKLFSRAASLLRPPGQLLLRQIRRDAHRCQVQTGKYR